MKKAGLAVAIGAGGGSLLAHALMFGVFARTHVAGRTSWLDDPAGREEFVVTVLPEDPEPEAPPEPAPPDEPEPEPLPAFAIGDEAGTGFATHEVKSDAIHTARDAEQDQAYLSRDLIGMLDTADAPAADAAPQAEGWRAGGTPPPLPSFSLPDPGDSKGTAGVGLPSEFRVPKRIELVGRGAAPAPTPEGEGKLESPLAGAAPAVKGPESEPLPASPSLTPVAPPTKPVAVAVSSEPFPSPDPANRPNPGDAAAPSAPQAAGDPAPPSDSEVDPFSQVGVAEYHDGRLEVQFGRKVKTRRPRFQLRGAIDLISGQHRATVVLRIGMDAAGKVTSVGVKKSSGSNEIDQPIVVAVYDWEFEPRKDAAGVAVPDDIEFTIGLR